MKRLVNTLRPKEEGRILARHPDGRVEDLGTYTNLKITVEDEIHGGEEPIPITVKKGLFLTVDEVGSPEWLPASKGGSESALSIIRARHAERKSETRAERRRRERSERR